MSDPRYGLMHHSSDEQPITAPPQRGPNPPPGMVATFDALAAKAREIQAQRAAAIRAETLREAADALDESETLRDLTDDHMHDVHAAANELRRTADDTAPPSALRRAHAALAEQAGRDQAAIRRVRDALAPYDWQHAQVPAAAIRRALDGPPEEQQR